MSVSLISGEPAILFQGRPQQNWRFIWAINELVGRVSLLGEYVSFVLPCSLSWPWPGLTSDLGRSRRWHGCSMASSPSLWGSSPMRCGDYVALFSKASGRLWLLYSCWRCIYSASMSYSCFSVVAYFTDLFVSLSAGMRRNRKLPKRLFPH